MSELKATPGPWEVNKNGDVVVKGSNAVVGYPPQSGCIASLADGEYIENYNRHDAHLIAAAPELYQRLKELHEGMLFDSEYMTSQHCKDIENLLDKAQGES